MSFDTVTGVKVWGWLFAACLAVLVGCCILTVDVHNTLNQYELMRTQDRQQARQEMVNAISAQSTNFDNKMNVQLTQMKLYVDVQVPVVVRSAGMQSITNQVNNNNGTANSNK